VVSREPQKTHSLQTAEGCQAELCICFEAEEMMENGSKPQENRITWSHASKCSWRNPISSFTAVLLLTFTTLTVADENNTYLCMHISRNQTGATEVYIPGKKL